MLGFSVLSSLLLGSAFGKAISTLLVYELGINLYAGGFIPAFSSELALAKTFDLLDFVLTIIIVISNFLFLQYFLKSKNKLVNIAVLIFNFILFLQIHFAAYNLVHILVFATLFNALLIIIKTTNFRLKNVEIDSNNLILTANGLLTGFYLMLIINLVTTTIVPLMALTLMPVVYLLPGKQIKKLYSFSHLFFALSIILPTNALWLALVGLTGVVLIFALEVKFSNLVLKYIYPAVFITLVVYNPLYFFGHLDSVEEGFWLGWLAGLKEGKVLYRDIAAYHPPLIIWLLHLFQKLFGYTIANTRLVLHLLQIIGIIFYYFAAKSLLRKKLSIFVVMLLAISLTTIMVRNNVEIRLGMGFLSLALLAHPFVAGMVASLALFTSTEVGIAASIAGVGILAFNRKNILKFLAGFGTMTLPVVIILAAQGSLLPMVTQISFYAKAFAGGFMNLPIERSVNSAFIHWHIINQYISAYPFLWELARAGLVGGLLIGVYKKDKLAVALSIFGLVLFRSALGRSDIYHLLFPLLVAVPLIFFIFEKLNYKYLVPLFSILLVLVFTRNIVNASFIEAKLYQLQTYGRAIGEQEKVLTNDNERLVQYIKQNYSKDQNIFVYPWKPEIYLLTERPNATKFYTPYAFYTEEYQKDMILELQSSKPPLIIYSPEMKFANLVPDSLPLINNYILENFKEVKNIGDHKILTK